MDTHNPECPIIDVLMPALNEELSLPLVLADLAPLRRLIRHVIVIDNGSTDRTAHVAREHGAIVLHEPRRGYGAACLRGLAYLKGTAPPDIVVFLDADRSDDAADLERLIGPLRAGHDLVLGSRVLGEAEEGALLPVQRLGNLLAVHLIRFFYGGRYTDLGPFRAIRFPALVALGMTDPGYGWTVEMQVKAIRCGLRVLEVPVRYRRRAAGRSKVSATVRGTLGAGYKIIKVILSNIKYKR